MNNEPVWQVPESTLKRLMEVSMEMGNALGSGRPTNAAQLNSINQLCRQSRALTADEADTLMNMIKQMKKDADRMNGEKVTIVMGNIPAIGGWDAQLIIAAPGVLDKGDGE